MNIQGPRISGPYDSNPVAGALGLVVAILGIWMLVCVAQLLFAAYSIAVSSAGVSGIAGLASNIAEGAFFGLFAGLVIGIVAAWRGKGGEVRNSFLSGLFDSNLEHSNFGAAFWGQTLIGAAIGLIVGVIAGEVGILSFPPDIASAAHTLMTDPNMPLVAFIGGGAGGFGGSGDLGFWGTLFLFFVVLVMVIIVAVVVGIVLHVLVYGVVGMTKGGVEAYVSGLITRRIPTRYSTEDKRQPIIIGMWRGFVVGLILGLFETTFTTWGAVALYHSQ